MKYIVKFFYLSFSKIRLLFEQYYSKLFLGYKGNGVIFKNFLSPQAMRMIYMEDKTNIFEGFTFLSTGGKLIMKSNSGAAQNLTVITGNHQRSPETGMKCTNAPDEIIEKDIIVENNVWLAANVTLLSGVKIGRGATIGANSVCTSSIPPYAIVMGNPAKVIGFNLTPLEIIEYEKIMYPEGERLSLELLQKNHNKYFSGKAKEIREFIRLCL